jgi:uroporphyrinogen decarboxylase
MKQIISQLGGKVPVIQFSLGTHGNWPDLVATKPNVIGIDWQTSLADVRKVIPESIGLQGNLSPTMLSDVTSEVAARETRAVLETMRGRAGHIFNLGHGVTPTAKLENISALVDTVRNFK